MNGGYKIGEYCAKTPKQETMQYYPYCEGTGAYFADI